MTYAIDTTTYIELYTQARKLEREFMAARDRADGINRILYQHSIDSVRGDMAAYERELVKRGYHWFFNRWLDADEYYNAMQDEAWEDLPVSLRRRLAALDCADMEED